MDHRRYSLKKAFERPPSRHSQSEEHEDDMSYSEGDVRESDLHDERERRVNSQDSEETALYNGRKTLEEVAAKLNDLEGSERAGGLGRTGLVSTSRLPFLSNLFNQRSQTNGIVVDEEDANQEDNPIADIFAWRFPFVSFLWFSILNILFFLFHFCDYSVLTVGSFLFLWQLIMDLALVKTVPALQAKGLISEDVNIHETIRRFTLFNPRLIQRVAGTSYELSDLVIGLWKLTVYEANMSRVLIVGRFVFVVFFRSFSIATTLWVLHLILFTIPVGYSTNRVIADAVADGAHAVANENLGRVRRFSRALVEKATERASYYYELSHRRTGENKPVDSLMAGVWAVALGAAQNFDWLVNRLIG